MKKAISLYIILIASLVACEKSLDCSEDGISRALETMSDEQAARYVEQCLDGELVRSSDAVDRLTRPISSGNSAPSSY
ncbi:MAG: hypothetical protein ACJA1I_001252 [Zhongshania marina]|jgi:hypothetical protein